MKAQFQWVTVTPADDTDIQFKKFGIIMLLFSIADTGVRESVPVVTIPANQ